MRVLLIAPTHTDLPAADHEIAAIQQFHDTVLLSGLVRDADIARAVTDGQGFDALWFITHGDRNGILLSDRALGTSGVGQYLKSSAAKLCVLNTCESEEIALRIANNDVDVICTLTKIDDEDAMRTGVLLASELSRTDDFRKAYEMIAPQGGMYRHYGARKQEASRKPQATRTSDPMDHIFKLSNSLFELRATIEAEIKVMSQQIVALRQQNELGERQLRMMESQVEAMNRQVTALSQVHGNSTARISEEQLRLILGMLGLIALIVLIGLFVLANGRGLI